MRIPKEILKRIEKLANPKQAKPSIAFIKKVSESDLDAKDHYGEYRATIGFWDGRPNSGDRYPSKFIYRKTEAEAFKVVEELSVPVSFYEDY